MNLRAALRQKNRMGLRITLVILFDLIAVILAWGMAYSLRYNFSLPQNFPYVIAITLPWVLIVHAAAFYRFGLYRGMWRFASLPDLKRILLAVGLAALVVPPLLFMVQRLMDVPRSVLILHPLLLVLVMGGARFAYRSWKDGHLLSVSELGREPLLVLGAGSAGADLLRALHGNRTWRVVGFLDDDSSKIGRQINEAPVLGQLSDIAATAAAQGVKNVVIAMPQAAANVRRRAAELAAAAGLIVLTVPTMDDLLSGKLIISQLRRVALEDLLGREPIALDEAGLRDLLHQKTVLVTGAGGSIGAELCRQIARFSPQRLVLLDQSELSLYQMEQEFSGPQFATVKHAARYVIGDVKDAARLAEIFAEHRPHVVFHAAAYKHVPLMEAANAWQAMRNNVLGTLNAARAAMACGASEFVLISTDKAVNPTNVMGASKRLAEAVCQALQKQSQTRFVAVRFGNVLGSSGSVIPLFREQIARGGPVTVTHPEIIRYFMLIPEAVQLVLQAGLFAHRDSEGGKIFVLDMGEPVKIVDLARDMIRLSGLDEHAIKIEFTGLRPGDKLFEELLADNESTLPTPHPKLRIAKASDAPESTWLTALEAWLNATSRNEQEVKQDLATWVAEYQPQGTPPAQ
ncbi:polysaccharide biosynthesis protein [Rugosibacter aromaticivorans]